jgi:hypothetical protein
MFSCANNMNNLFEFPDNLDIDKILYDLERSDLDQNVPDLDVPLWGEIEGATFCRVMGQAAYWRSTDLIGYSNVMEDLITSLYGQGEDFYFLVLGQGNRIGIYLGESNRYAKSQIRPLLTASFPGIRLDPGIDDHLGTKLEASGFLKYRGRLTGIPSNILSTETDKRFKRKEHPDQKTFPTTNANLERLIRGLQGSQWGFFIHAIPYPQSSILKDMGSLLLASQQVQARTHLQIQKVNQILKKVDEVTQAGETNSISTEMVNRKAEYVLTRIENQLNRFQRIRAEGGWFVDSHFFSPDELILKRMQSLLRAVFVSSTDSPEPLRTFQCISTKQKNNSKFSTLLSSSEIVRFAYLPKEEVPGYQIQDFTTFDVDQKVDLSKDILNLGAILDNGRETTLPYTIPLDTFSQHVLVTGVTGSGKTTTILALLETLSNRQQNHSFPFLIIEPTKSEYRALLGKPAGTGAIPSLKVFTLGDENVCPFRLNPLQFEILDNEFYTHVQTHIDYLKSVFSAAFVLYPPMPYILEICLHEIYVDRGWNLTTSRNDRLPSKYWPKAYEWPVFPTLNDLYQKIDEVIERSGYDEQIKMDVKAGLQTRISSMMLGGKGLMLNTPCDGTMELLLDGAVVLELDRIGDDEEKIFLMGLILTRLFEYRRLQFLKHNSTMPFQHLTVIEEAHRLLRAVPMHSNPDLTNIKGQAIETFTNILSEIRAYGEGFLIAEQIPSKLTPDALKNTNLKIVHRVIAEDDRKSISGATNMNDAQSRYMVVIPRGDAIVFNQGDDHPILIRITPSPTINLNTRPADEEIRRIPIPYTFGDPINLLDSLKVNSKENIVKSLATMVLTSPEFEIAWCTSHILLMQINIDFQQILEPIEQLVQRFLGSESDLHNAVMAQVFLEGSRLDYYRRGRIYGWNYEEISNFRMLLLHSLTHIVNNKLVDFQVTVSEFLTAIKSRNKVMNGPHPGCTACKERCIYRYDLMVIARDSVLQQEWKMVLLDPEITMEAYHDLMQINRNTLRLVLGEDKVYEESGLLICLSAQLMNNLKISSRSQSRIINHLCEAL